MDKEYGLLIDYEYCSGCQSCEVACKEEHNYAVGQWGIRVFDDGPWEYDDGEFNWNKIPVPTDLCDLCAARTAEGREPTCVHHCLANVIRYDTVEELAKMLTTKRKQVLWVPQYKPKQARGKFVSAGKGRMPAHAAADVTATVNEHFSTSSQRADSRTSTGLDNE
jgi:Fe-S-cluster-containing dehydrogenase component